jgi:hypothetical protein
VLEERKVTGLAPMHWATEIGQLGKICRARKSSYPVEIRATDSDLMGVYTLVVVSSRHEGQPGEDNEQNQKIDGSS